MNWLLLCKSNINLLVIFGVENIYFEHLFYHKKSLDYIEAFVAGSIRQLAENCRPPAGGYESCALTTIYSLPNKFSPFG